MPRAADVQTMFTAIAGRYDLLNHLLSFGLAAWWWRRMAEAAGAGPGKLMLDVAAGTGDSSIALARKGAEVISTDFTHAMLRLGPPKFVRRGLASLIWASVDADALRLPFQDSNFDGVTICYGIRNVERRDVAFKEFLRVLKPGGRVTVLEFSRPRYAWLRFGYGLYSRHVLPRIGRWVSGDAGAYTYLPTSIQEFPEPQGVAEELIAAGFGMVQWRRLSGGIVTLHVGTRP